MKSHEKMIDELYERIRKSDKYKSIDKTLNFGEWELDLLGIVDDDFVDLFEVKCKSGKHSERSAYWQLMRDAHALDGLYFVRDLYYYNPSGLFRLLGCEFVEVKQ